MVTKSTETKPEAVVKEEAETADKPASAPKTAPKAAAKPKAEKAADKTVEEKPKADPKAASDQSIDESDSDSQKADAPNAQDIPVEDLVNGVINVLGDGLEAIINSSSSAQKNVLPHAKTSFKEMVGGVSEGFNDLRGYVENKLSANKDTSVDEDIDAAVATEMKSEKESQSTPQQ
ncbi:putative head maturation protease, phage-related [Candidatus Terasakiella magnetica]|uniref:Putative head maturation protease, phage-related n=1 Tax=Candidatus Terasakiella magnetica TaxID=1867952 RepID=A0A1C3RFR2_9PROT|nr:hypothetical protein [Candidatus Terasakiella magnetica]SCA56091.1 putative head maturation protease, phage-related [Candidatus Terasakiella magnetica]